MADAVASWALVLTLIIALIVLWHIGGGHDE